MKRRDLTPEELDLWQRAMRNTTPLPGRDVDVAVQAQSRASAPAISSFGDTASAQENISPASADTKAPRSGASHMPSGLDAATQRRLRRGRTEIDGRVDLHGMRQTEARNALCRFIAESQAAGRRCVLVITGKGGRTPDNGEAPFMHRTEEGVLRSQVPLWLRQEPNVSRIFAVEQAHVRHGGSGAFYVFLRRAQRGSP